MPVDKERIATEGRSFYLGTPPLPPEVRSEPPTIEELAADNVFHTRRYNLKTSPGFYSETDSTDSRHLRRNNSKIRQDKRPLS